MKDRESHPSPLIGNNARVTNKYSKWYGQIGTIVGVQSSPEDHSGECLDINDKALQDAIVEADPNAEFQWEEDSERPLDESGLRTVIICFGEESALEYQEIEVLDRSPK